MHLSVNYQPRSGAYNPNIMLPSYQYKGFIPRANKPIDNNINKISSRIFELSRYLGMDRDKEQQPEFKISQILKESIKINDLDAAWEHYLNNFKDMQDVTAKLGALGFENPFLDRDGIIGALAEHCRYKSDKFNPAISVEFNTTIDIIKTLLRKRDKFRTLEESKEYFKDDPFKLFKTISPNIVKRIVYNDSIARDSGLQLPDKTLESEFAQCFEYSILFYMAAIKAGLKAGIVIVPGHAYNWMEIRGILYEIDLTLDYEEFRSYNIAELGDEILLPKLKADKASAIEILFTYHYTKAYYLSTAQKQFEEADKLLKVAHGIDPTDDVIGSKLKNLAKKIFHDNKISNYSAYDFINNKDKLSEKDRAVLEHLYEKYYSVRKYFRSMKEWVSTTI